MTEEIPTQKAKLFKQLENIDANRERIEADLKKVRDAEEAKIAELENLVSVHRTARRRVEKGKEKQAEIEGLNAEEATRWLNPWDNREVSAQVAIDAFTARAAKEIIRSQFDGWLKLAEEQERAAFSEVCEFVASNHDTINNYVPGGCANEFRRLLPGSISEYSTSNK